MRLVRVTAIYSPRTDNTDRRLLGFHGTDLHARRMGTQQVVDIKIEGIVHGTCRVMSRDIQGFKVMIVIFNFWTCRADGTSVNASGPSHSDVLAPDRQYGSAVAGFPWYGSARQTYGYAAGG